MHCYFRIHQGVVTTNKEMYMLRIKILFILFACLMALSSSFASDLTERNVMQLIAQVDNAVNRLDARGLHLKS